MNEKDLKIIKDALNVLLPSHVFSIKDTKKIISLFNLLKSSGIEALNEIIDPMPIIASPATSQQSPYGSIIRAPRDYIYRQDDTSKTKVWTSDSTAPNKFDASSEYFLKTSVEPEPEDQQMSFTKKLSQTFKDIYGRRGEKDRG